MSYHGEEYDCVFCIPVGNGEDPWPQSPQVQVAESTLEPFANSTEEAVRLLPCLLFFSFVIVVIVVIVVVHDSYQQLLSPFNFSSDAVSLTSC